MAESDDFPGEDAESIRKRLVVLRQHVAGDEQGSQTRFAVKVGLEVKRWNNLERGFPLSKDVALRLARRIPGLTTDWLWRGKEEGLTAKLRDDLAAIQRDLAAGNIASSADR